MSTRTIETIEDWDASDEAWILFDALLRGRFLRRTYPKSQRRRKLRLYCCAMARELWSRLDAEQRLALEIAERFAEDTNFDEAANRARTRERFRDVVRARLRDADREDRRVLWVIRACLWSNDLLQAAAHHVMWETPYAVSESLWKPPRSGPQEEWQAKVYEQRRLAAEMLRTIFRCPFLPPADLDVDPSVRRWARSISDERRFDELAVLGDAVEESGCDDRRLLDQLRGDGPHVPGMWALDRVIGRV